MFDSFKNLLPAANSAPNKQRNRGYTFAFEIKGLDDVWDAQQIWERPRFVSGDKRMKEIVSSHTYSVGKKAPVVFHNFIIEVPTVDIEDDRRITDGQCSTALCRALENKIVEEFGKRLGKDMTPRCTVRANTELASGSIRLVFGHAQHVRGQNDIDLWKLETSLTGSVWSLAGTMASEQRLLTLGANSACASIAVSDWPFPADLGIVIENDANASTLRIGSEPFGKLKIQEDTHLSQALKNSIYAISTEDNMNSVGLYLRVTRLVEARKIIKPEVQTTLIASGDELKSSNNKDIGISSIQLIPDATLNTSNEATTFVPSGEEVTIDQFDDDNTFVPGLTPKCHSMTLAAIAVQRVSAFSEAGIKGLSFGLDSSGNVVPMQSNTPPALGFVVNEKDALSVVTHEGRAPIQSGHPLPVPKLGGYVQFNPVPEEMTPHYIAFCVLPRQKNETIGVGARFSVGTKAPALKSLRALAGKGFLIRDNPAPGDRMGLSRQAFQIEVGKEGLVVTPTSPTQVLYQLDEEMNFIGKLDTDIKSTWLLLPGHHLVAGHYVFRYDA
jgi:hypothetical protein